MPLTGTDWGGSRLAKWTCKRAYYNTYVRGGTGLVQIDNRAPLEFGNAVHEAFYWFYTKLVKEPDAIHNNLEGAIVDTCKIAVDHIEALSFQDPELSLLRSEVMVALDLYMKNYEGEILGTKPGMTPLEAEVPIDVMVGPYKHTGRIDLVGEYQGFKCLPDHKTTSKDWGRFFKGIRLNTSQRGYAFAWYQKTGERLHILINGIRRRKTKDFDVEFMRFMYEVTDKDFKEFEAYVIDTRQDIDKRDPQDIMQWPQNPDACVRDYVCEYFDSCLHEELLERFKLREVAPEATTL